MLSGFAYVNPLDHSQTTWIGDAFTNDGHTYTLPIGATYQIGSNVAGAPVRLEGLRRAFELHLRGQ